MEKKFRKLSLLVDDRPLYVDDKALDPLKQELEEFLHGIKYMKTKKFSKEVLFSHEIQANNVIEGYYDDVSLVDNVIHRRLDIKDEARKRRILNLYKGYRYILTSGKPINKETLNELYGILSDGLLEKGDIEHMGKYYRNEDVYIFFSDRLDIEPDMGIPASEIDRYMDILLEYMHGEHPDNCLTDIYLVSQVAHFYFCYIHPYYDINGRTARTTAMWHLLNRKAYPYIIFNRGIQLTKQTYYKIIRDVKKYKNVTYFLNYMMASVKVELEKEYIMEQISQSYGNKLSSLDYQTMQYILSMNGNLTYADFAKFYNSQNEHKKLKEIYDTMLEPMIDKGIIVPTRETSKICSGLRNHVFELNPNMYELDPDKIKRISLVNQKNR